MIKALQKILNSQFFAISLYSRTIASTVVLFAIARYLSMYDFGLFSSYKNIATFCFMFANMDFANYILVSSQANIKEIRLKIALFLVNAINIGILIILFSLLFKLESHFLFFLVIIRTFFDSTFFALILPYFQASRKFNAIAKINIFYSVFIVIIALISFILKLSLAKFLLLNIGLGLINFVQCSHYVKISYFTVLKSARKLIQKLDKSIFGYMGSTITDYLYTQVSSLYVAIFVSKEDAALYFASATICSIASLIVIAQSQKMTPELIKSNYSETIKIIKANIKYVMIILITVLIFIIFCGKYLLVLLYGHDSYKNAYYILIIYFISCIFIANGGIFGAYLTAINQQIKKVKMKFETTILTIICLLALHKLGIYGAVYVLLISSIYASIRYTLCGLKYLKIQKEKEYESRKI